MPVVRKIPSTQQPIQPVVQPPRPPIGPTLTKPASGPLPSSNSKSSANFYIIIIAVLIVIIGFGGVYFFLNINKKVAPVDSTALIQKEQAQLLEQVDKLILLPVNETPTIATVADLEKIKNEPLFAGAQIGDKVIVYTRSLKMILYRPSINKIIEAVMISPPSVPNTAPVTSSTTSAN